MKLAHHHALGTVYYEGALLGDQGYLAEIDFLLDDVLDFLRAVLGLLDYQPQGGLERGREGRVALLALIDGVLGLAQAVADEFQRVVVPRVGDREDLPEHLLEPVVLPLRRRNVGLQEVPERIKLNGQEVGKLHYLLYLRVDSFA